MKTNTIYKLLIACLALVMLSGCKDSYLDTQPSSSISEEAATSTLNNFDYILNGMHNYVYDYRFTQGYAGEPNLNILRDMLGEDLLNSSRGNGWFISECRWLAHTNPRSNAVYVPWRFYYRLILNANGILENIDNPDLKGEKKKKDRIKAEALTYRAWCHFQLVQLFGKRYQGGVTNDQMGVVIRDSVARSEKPRATVEETYAFINQDLDEALNLYKSASLWNKNRITQVAAIGVKARVALVQQNWSDAAKYATEAIKVAKTKGIDLQKGKELLSGFNDMDANKEWIWAYKQTGDQNKYYAHYLAYMSWNFSSSNIRGNPKMINSKLYETMSETDIRRKWWDPGYYTDEVDKKGKPIKVWHPSKEYEKNYPRKKNFERVPYATFKYRAQDTGNSSGHMLLMRIAEMYYIAAEAYAHAGDYANAQEYLYKIMKTRDPKYQKSASTGNELLEEIWTNRRIDLWGEGFRFTDLKRLNQPLDRESVPNTVKNVSRKMSVPAGDKEWQFLIPQSEMESNKNMKQNEL